MLLVAALGTLLVCAWLMTRTGVTRTADHRVGVTAAAGERDVAELRADVSDGSRGERTLAVQKAVPARDLAQDRTLRPPESNGALTIEVQDADGRPVGGIELEVEVDSLHHASTTDKGKTDDDGHFTTSALYALEIETIRVTGGTEIDLTNWGMDVWTAPETPRLVVVRLPRLREIRVQVDPPAQPNGERWAVWVEPSKGASIDPYVCVLDVDERGGFYASEGTLSLTVAEGHYWVSVSESDQDPIAAFVEDDPTIVDLKIAPSEPKRAPPPPVPTLVRGRVVAGPSGQPIRALVRSMHSPKLPGRYGAWSGHSGEFQRSITDRVRYISARLDGYAFGIVGPFDAASAPELEIVVQPAVSVSGRVVDANGESVASGRVRLYRSNTQLQPLGQAPAPAPLDVSFEWVELEAETSGAFAFEGVTQDVLELRYEPYDPAFDAAEVRVEGGDHNVVIVTGVGAVSTATLRGRVRSAATGAVVHGACLSLSATPRPFYLTRRPEVSFTNASGEFILAGEPGEAYTISAWMIPRSKDRYVARNFESVRFEPGMDDLVVELEPATTLHVRVVDDEGKPLNSATLRATTGGGEAVIFQSTLGQPEGTSRVTDQGGRVDLHGIPFSPFTLSVVAARENRIVAPEVALSVDPATVERGILTVRIGSE